jgi:acyl dehydratase
MQISEPTIINGIDQLLSRAGEELGVSDWHQITQEDVDAFADVTHDRQWIHVDRERAAASPFGGTIAHGFFTLALLPHLQHGVYRVDGTDRALNYGLDRVRFPAPVPVGSSVRLRVELSEVDAKDDWAAAKFTNTIECDAAEKPVCVAVTLVRYYGAAVPSA